VPRGASKASPMGKPATSERIQVIGIVHGNPSVCGLARRHGLSRHASLISHWGTACPASAKRCTLVREPPRAPRPSRGPYFPSDHIQPIANEIDTPTVQLPAHATCMSLDVNSRRV